MNKPVTLAAVMLMLIMATAAPASAALTDRTGNLKLWWTFDDADNSGSDPLDQSGNSNDGTNTGTLTGKEGLNNEAFQHDATADNVLCDNAADAVYGGGNHAFTASLLINVTDGDWTDNLGYFTIGAEGASTWCMLGGS